MRFWKVTSRILRGVKSVGGFADRALPAGVFWAGVKYGVLGAAGFFGDIVGGKRIARRNRHNGHKRSINKGKGAKQQYIV
jgi:hypothetical protein